MTSGDFSRPGAFDLSALASRQPASGPTASGAGGFSVDVGDADFEMVIRSSEQHPVVMSFWSAKSAPSVQINQTLEKLADEFAGQFLFAKVDVDAEPGIASAVQIPSVPLVAVALRGQLAPLLQQPVPEAELRAVLQQVVQAAVANGVTGRAAPRPGVEPVDGSDEPAVDPRYDAAEQALERGDLDTALAAYETVLAQSPGDPGALSGVARVGLLTRTRDADPGTARAAAAASPDDVDAAALVADLDLLDDHVEDAFNRMIDVVKVTSGDERDRARAHLIDLFAAVGDDDPRVRTARQRLASALF
jgi:putative thioredoxin